MGLLREGHQTKPQKWSVCLSCSCTDINGAIGVMATGEGGAIAPLNFGLSENCLKISPENFCLKIQNLGLKNPYF